MKKTICFIAALALSFAAIAQEHILFKNTPVTGPVSEFVEKMKAAGFTLSSESDGVASMRGTFAGQESLIMISFSPRSKTVFRVSVHIGPYSTWNSAKRNHESMKESFVSKYGAPLRDFHFFSRPYYEGDGYELQGVANDKGHYATYWQLETGYISVVIVATDSSTGWVRISYEDSDGLEVKNREVSAITNDDI